MRRSILTILRAAIFAAFIAPAHLCAKEAEPWNVVSDVPDPRPAVAGLAGEEPPNIVRFLKVLGAGRTAISPAGDYVAYVARTTGEPQLWIVDATGGAPRQLTFGTGVRTFNWTPDGELLVAADNDGDEREGYTILSVDGRKEQRILDQTAAFNVFGDFSADGSKFVFATTRRNGVDFDIYLGDARGGGAKELYRGEFGYYAHAWRPGSNDVLVSETSGEDANNLYLLNTDNGEIKTLFKPADRASFTNLVWAPEGNGFYLSTNYEREFEALAFVELSGKGVDLRFIDTPDQDISNVQLAGKGRYLIWTVNDGGYDRIKGRDLRHGRDLKLPSLPDGVYRIHGAADASKISVQVSGPATPGDVWIVDLKEKAAKQIVVPSDAGLDLASFSKPTAVSFKARDGLTLHGLLYLPKNGISLGARPPVVMGLHGGPTAQSRPRFEPVTEYLLSRGIGVFQLNFRGSSGYGKAFARLNDKRLRANEIYDVADAVAYLGSRSDVDASRIVPMGGSYGGYLVNAAMGEFPDLFAGGVSFVGVTDWIRALEGASPALKAADRIEYGDINDPADRKFFEEISPIRNVDKIRAPMLVVHGANDPRDPVTESDLLVKKLRANNVPVTYLRFRDEGHSISKLRNRVHAYREVVRFLEDKLAPRDAGKDVE